MNRYQPISTNTDIRGCVMNTWWLTCVVMFCMMSSVTNKLCCWQPATTGTTQLKPTCRYTLMLFDDIIKCKGDVADKYRHLLPGHSRKLNEFILSILINTFSKKFTHLYLFPLPIFYQYQFLMHVPADNTKKPIISDLSSYFFLGFIYVYQWPRIASVRACICALKTRHRIQHPSSL